MTAEPHRPGATPAAPLPLPLPRPWTTVLEAARQAVAMLRHRRFFWLMPVAFAVLFVFGYVLGGRAVGRIDGVHFYCVIAWWALGTVVMPWTALYLGVQVLHAEIEDRTSQYLFLRPVRRVWLLLGKWLGIAVVAAVATAASAAVLFASLTAHAELRADGLSATELQTFAGVLAVGAVAYTAAGVFFAATFRRPLAWAAFFVVGVQMLAGNLPVSAGLRSLTITDPLRRLLLEGLEPSRRLAADLWPAEHRDALDAFAAEVPEHAFAFGAPLNNLLIFVLACLVLAGLRYSRTEFESRGRD